ncbi:hydantoinase/oxoprolinase family protein [Actinomadura napierensis]|uniref:Hydantoinase/oxoprolinase family protein n=1 Tax=Actinomadura napierensis TaxID=267854 RepID=A0ABP5LGA8_9ACTN
MMTGATCIGVDVGGTFTDVVLSDGAHVWRAKAATTPGDLGRGVLDACGLVAAAAGTTLQALLPNVARFGLGTTAVTNAIASRTGRRVGLVTTAGFEDLVPIAKALRVPTGDGWLMPPAGLIDPERIVGVTERIDRTGTVITGLAAAEVEDAGRRLVHDHGAEALVVSFLWSCANDEHERAATELLRGAFPGVEVFSGAELLPVVREFERTQFALLNAYTSGALAGVETLVEDLMALGLPNPPLLVHSGGGSISVAEGHGAPATLAESGPAAGVVAGLAFCAATGVTDAVTADLGGTSFDVSFISAGEPTRRNRGELMGVWTALPMIDIDSVGAGGGSIGWPDALGILRVGPRSAGAQPGPACYGRGGTDPTVTDALVVLGYIDPDMFLGGDMVLDGDAALRACAQLGAQLGMDALQTAWGVWEVAKATMVRALRARFAERGCDPRGFSLISMGGCGALVSAPLAHELGLRSVLIPDLASVMSAFGAATSDVRRERSRSVTAVVPAASGPLAEVADRLTAEVRADLAADGIGAGAMAVELVADMRFSRQKHELQIPWTGGFDAAHQAEHLERFRAEYQSRYGRGAIVSGAPVEIVTLHAVGTGRTVRAALTADTAQAAGAAPISRYRPVHVSQQRPALRVPVVNSADLRPGHQLAGPALVDAPDTTVWVPEGQIASVDSLRTLHLVTAP